MFNFFLATARYIIHGPREGKKFFCRIYETKYLSEEKEKRFFLPAVGSQLELSSMGFDYTYYLNASLKMSEWAGCNSNHLVPAIMEEVAQMHCSNGCRARGITRGPSLM